MAKCKFTVIPCPKQCKNDDTEEVNHFMRKDLANHLARKCPQRDFKCKHCGKMGTYAYITEVHDTACEDKAVPCPNAECTDAIERRGIKRHLEICMYTEVPCKYQRLGCDVKMKRDGMVAHEDEDKLHLHMALNTITTMEERLISVEERMDDYGMVPKVLKDGVSFTFKVRKFAQKKAGKEVFRCSSFYTGPKGYHMDISVYPGGEFCDEGTHVSIYARLLDGENDAQLKWPFVGKVNITLLNQLSRKHFKLTMNIISEDNLRARGHGYPKFISHSELACTGNTHTQYLKDDTLFFRVTVTNI